MREKKVLRGKTGLNLGSEWQGTADFMLIHTQTDIKNI